MRPNLIAEVTVRTSNIDSLGSSLHSAVLFDCRLLPFQTLHAWLMTMLYFIQRA